MPNVPQASIDAIRRELREMHETSAGILTDPRYLDSLKGGHVAWAIGNEIVSLYQSARTAIRLLEWALLSKEEKAAREQERRDLVCEDTRLAREGHPAIATKIMALHHAADALARADAEGFYTDIQHLKDCAEKLRSDLATAKAEVLAGAVST